MFDAALAGAAAALLFLLEPLVGRLVAPHAGGTAQVWIALLCFFQAALLAGYALAYAMTRILPVRPRMVAYAVTAAGVAWLADTPSAQLASRVSLAGALEVALACARAVGPPFVLLAMTTPMLAELHGPSSRARRWLYAASNAGSFVGLLAYPLVIETSFGLRDQAAGWRVAFRVVAAILAVRAVGRAARAREERADDAARPAEPAPREALPARPLGLGGVVLLSASTSCALSGVTTYITTDVAPVPMLWVAPLALYLLTFVDAFATRHLVPDRAIRLLARAGLLVSLALIVAPRLDSGWGGILLHLFGFAVVAAYAHRAIAAHALPGARLYLSIALGGALGGGVAALVAPLVFQRVLEYPLALAVAFVVATWLDGPRPQRRDLAVDAAYAVLVTACAWLASIASTRRGMPEGPARDTFVLLAPALLLLVARREPWRLALSFVALVVLAPLEPAHELVARSFFGVVRVERTADGAYRRFVHGTTTHGMQSTSPERAGEPLLYFTRQGPVGDVFRSLAAPAGSRRVLVLGLGAGTLAAYAERGDHMTFVEVDPLVRDLVESGRSLSFVADARSRGARVDVLVGDARRVAQRLAAHEFDLVVLDAFASDALATHLLTREALGVYRRALRPGGLVLANASNRYLALDRLTASLGADARVRAFVRHDERISAADLRNGRTRSVWVVLGARVPPGPTWQVAKAAGAAWTDDRIVLWDAVRN